MTEQHIELLRRTVAQAQASNSDIGLGANVLAALLDEHDRLRADVARLRAALDAADDMANALVAYFNKRGVDHSMRKGNEDIGALADALSTYGPLRYDEMTARAALAEPNAAT